MMRCAGRKCVPWATGSACSPARALPSPTRLSLAIAAALSGAATVHMAPALAAEASTATATSTSTLEEVIVTARKRTENLQDVPISIDVYTSKDLQNLAISQFEDYATMTPSISFVSAGPGTQTFVMRGVSDGSNPNYANTATTAFLVDDMSMNFSGTTPDLHLYDIERIEVLNGPQGTTFGASAMAGALRFITNKPDAERFQRGRRSRRRQDRRRNQERHRRGVHEHTADPRLDGAAPFRLSRLSRRLHRQHQHAPGIGSTGPSPTIRSGRDRTITSSV